MVRLFSFFLLAFVMQMGFAAPAASAEPPPLLRTIPKGAIKVGPIGNRNGSVSHRYLDPETRELVAEENLHRGRRKLSLFRNGKKHGVQQEWHEDGKKKLEAPYCDGTMHGVFRHWDKKGNLIGCYRMVEGTGVKLVFHSNGRLREERHYRNGKRHGASREFVDNGHVNGLSWYRHGLFGKRAFTFHRNDGRLSFLCVFDSDGKYHGPCPHFDHTGKTERLTLYLHGKEVSAAEYRKACKTDSTLPRYEEDPQKYRKLLTPDVKELIAKYKQLKPVNIPLDGPMDWKKYLPGEPGAAGGPEKDPTAPQARSETAPLEEGPSVPITALAGIAAGLLLLVAILVLRRRRSSGAS